MCGRLNQFATLPSLSLAGKELGVQRRKKRPHEDRRSEVPVVNNICPTDYADALLQESDAIVSARMRFGLIPQWAKGSKTDVWKKFMLTFNARCETIFDLASYRVPVRRQRCLIPVRGWHEWPDSKTPYYIHRADDQPLLLAGIWDAWESLDPSDEASGPLVTSMSVVTTPPGRYMAKFHDRSPLLLEGESALAWLLPDLKEAEIREFMRPSADAALEAYRVSKAANNARNKSEEVRQAIAAPVLQAGDEPVKSEEEASSQLKLF